MSESTLVGATDAELLAAHVAGHRDAFAMLVRRHIGYLMAVALRSTHCLEDAEDAVQEALHRAHRQAARFRSDAKVTSWLHRIVVNSCLDLIRRNRSRAVVPLADRDQIAALNDPIDERLNAMVINDAVAQLPPDQRDVVRLLIIEGRSVAAVAEILGIPTGTVKSRAARGRRRLMGSLGVLRPNHIEGEPPTPEPRPSKGTKRPTERPDSRTEAREM